jgi:chromosomal replication initiation ATPase DnaA
VESSDKIRYYTKGEAVIQGFIEKYGIDALVKWLGQYSKIISQKDFNTFHRIQKTVCEVYSIPIADVNSRNSTNPDHSDAKKTITYLIREMTNLKPKHIEMLQGCTSRTVYNHIVEVEFRVKKRPEAFRSFVEKFNQIISKL